MKLLRHSGRLIIGSALVLGVAAMAAPHAAAEGSLPPGCNVGAADPYNQGVLIKDKVVFDCDHAVGYVAINAKLNRVLAGPTFVQLAETTQSATLTSHFEVPIQALCPVSGSAYYATSGSVTTYDGGTWRTATGVFSDIQNAVCP